MAIYLPGGTLVLGGVVQSYSLEIKMEVGEVASFPPAYSGVPGLTGTNYFDWWVWRGADSSVIGSSSSVPPSGLTVTFSGVWNPDSPVSGSYTAYFDPGVPLPATSTGLLGAGATNSGGTKIQYDRFLLEVYPAGTLYGGGGGGGGGTGGGGGGTGGGTAPGQPGAPTGTGTCEGAKNTLFFTLPSQASGVEITRNGVVIAGSVSSSPYVDTGVVLGGSYTYTLRAFNAVGFGPSSDPLTIVPCSPAGGGGGGTGGGGGGGGTGTGSGGGPGSWGMKNCGEPNVWGRACAPPAGARTETDLPEY